MATLRYIINGVTVYPELPIDIEDAFIGETQQMADGSEAAAYLAVKRRWVIRLTGATEAERTTWFNAAVLNVAFTLTDEQNVNYTVRVDSRRQSLTATDPASNATYYDLEISLRQI